MADREQRPGQDSRINKSRYWWIPHFLLSDALILVVFRIVVASSISATALVLWLFYELRRAGKRPMENVVGASVIGGCLHHLGMVLGPRLFPLPMWLDIFLTAAEFSGCIASGSMWSEWLGVRNLQDDPPFHVLFFYSTSILCLTAALGCLCLLKAVHFLNKLPKIRIWLEPIQIAGLCSPGEFWWNHPTRVIFGRRVWRECVPGEPVIISIIRGTFSLLSGVALLAFAIRQAVLLPLSEMGRIPYRTYRAPWSNEASWTRTFSYMDSLPFKVLLAWIPHTETETNLTEAVAVTARWPNFADSKSSIPITVTCSAAVEDLGTRSYPWGEFDMAVLACPRPQQHHYVVWPAGQVGVPDIDITVNYTGILGSRFSDLGVSPNRVVDSMRVYLGLNNDARKVLGSSEPVHLFPGTNMLSIMHIVQRVRLGSARLAMLGVESEDRFLVASIAQTIQNPFAGPVTHPNISTLCFSVQMFTDEFTIIQDYSEKSVISGLSQFGGFGSLLSTLLCIILGTSLVQVFFRTRPSSPFGFIHGIDITKRRMVKTCGERYPALRDDLLRVEEESGLLAFLLRALIDVEPLQSEAEQEDAQTGAVTEHPNELARHALIGEDQEAMGGELDEVPENASETEGLIMLQEIPAREARGLV